jgi:hypothetical protein
VSNFATAFRELVMPDMRRMCRLQAVFIAHGRHSFTHGSGVAWRLATRRGATHLPVAVVDQLDDWIDTTILTTIAEIEASPDTAPAIVDEYLEAACL